ncbi:MULTISPECIES: hypothetical protein [unclassified Streptomyces]|uniref:hypothetical protein n=1 Tax=unclassified Streptomyces TaxID=2593676 RepID=UPI002E2B226C|nr:hypothetical protein [Streptomyces sp. NBC_01429]
MNATAGLDEVIAAYASGEFDDATPLAEVGVASLAVLRIVIDVFPDPSYELNTEELAAVSTVGDLKRWLCALPGVRA